MSSAKYLRLEYATRVISRLHPNNHANFQKYAKRLFFTLLLPFLLRNKCCYKSFLKFLKR